jgi:signal transduction histidine kinase
VAFTEKIDLLSRLMADIGVDLRRAIEALGPLADSDGGKQPTESIERLRGISDRIAFFPIRGLRGARDIEIGTLVSGVVSEAADGTDTEVLQEVVDKAAIPAVLANSDQLTEALRQVLDNAVNAAGDTGGAVRVVTRGISHSRAESHREFILPPGDYVHIQVSDDGGGIPAPILPHVFDPLFSTRGGGPLAGLGLAVAYGIIKNHRGYIDIDSIQGSGTTVDIYLPRSRSSEAKEEAPLRADELYAEAVAEHGEPRRAR